MKIDDLDESVGRIVKGVNTTVDVAPNEIKTQAAKFGNSVDKDGKPPTMSKKVTGKSTNVLYNLGMVKEDATPRYTAAEWAIIEGGHSLDDVQPVKPKQPGRIFTSLTEGYKLQLERDIDNDMYVLHILDTKSGKRTEVRGKSGYETNNDPDDKLHQLLDQLGKSANFAELINGETVTINPKHPDAMQALAATDRAYNEAFDTKVDWIKGAAPQGASVYAAKVDDAYIEITYKPMQKGVYISFTRGARMSVTGEGGQNKIFGAVINHIKQWVDKNKPQEIYFSAFKPRTGAFGSQDDTRSGLYRKMVQRFASQNGYDYDVEDTGNEDTFILKRKQSDTQTNEALDNPYPIDWNLKTNNQWYGLAKDGEFHIQIKEFSPGYWSILFRVGGTLEKTNAGDQFRIFATAKQGIAEWWKNNKTNVDGIMFSADKILDSSRATLYSRLAKQFATSIGYDLEVSKGTKADIYNLKKPGLEENFADGKKPGRKGLAKRSGVNTKASVSSLRKTAKNSSGEKARMAHWLANMKSGKKKK